MKLNLKPRLAVIFLQYDTQKYPGAFEHLKSYLSKFDPKRVFFVLVNNRDEGNGSRNLDDGTVYLQGDNTDWEFSGWQKGVEFMRTTNTEHDVVLFVDDAFEACEPSYLLNHNLHWLVLKCYTIKVVFGAITTLWDKTMLNTRSARIWIKTNCFFMPGSVLGRLGTLVSVDETLLDNYVTKQFVADNGPFKHDAPMNGAYRKHIVIWLTERWHSKFALSESTWPFFRAKVKAILNEALLSIRIRELGFMILPYDIPLFVFIKIRGAFRRAKKIVLHEKEQVVGHSVLNGH
jgi:hypothetical protein